MTDFICQYPRSDPPEKVVIVLFTAADAEAIAGRKLTHAEITELRRIIGHSIMGDVFAESVELVIENR